MAEVALAVVHTPDQIKDMAGAIVRSQLFPNIKTVDAAVALMLLCQAEGIHPMLAMRRWDIIQGRPALKTDAMLAEFQKRGGKVKWLRLDNEVAEAEFMAFGLEAPVRIKFDTEDAKRAGLLTKDNWVKYPRPMRRARVISEGVRTADPGVNAGVYTTEEVQDFDESPRRNGPSPAAAIQEAIEETTASEKSVAVDVPFTEEAAEPAPAPPEPNPLMTAREKLPGLLHRFYGPMNIKVMGEKAVDIHNLLIEQETGKNPNLKPTKGGLTNPQAEKVVAYLEAKLAAKEAPGPKDGAPAIEDDEAPPVEGLFEAPAPAAEVTPLALYEKLWLTVVRARKLFPPREFIKEAPPESGVFWFVDQEVLKVAGHSAAIKMQKAGSVATPVATLTQLTEILTAECDKQERGGR